MFHGDDGYLRAYGQQSPLPGTYAGANVYQAELSLNWTVFDGGRRRNEIEQARASHETGSG